MTFLDRGDEGVSLVETLIAIVIAGLTVVTIVAGYGTAIRGASRHADLAYADAVARSVAGSLEGQAYLPCPASAYSRSAPDIAYPTGWTASTVSLDVDYWHAGSDRFGDSCPDEGLQRITITVTSPNGRGVRDLSVFKGSPA